MTLRWAIRFLRTPAAIYLGSAVLSRAGGLFLVPLYTRRLSPTEFGTLALANTLSGVLPILLTLGLVAGLGRVYFDRPVDEDAAIRFKPVANLLATLAVTAGATAAAALWLFWPPGVLGFSNYQVAMIAAGAVGSSLAGVPDTWFRAQRRPWVVAGMSLGSFSLLVVTSLYLVLSEGRGLDGIIEAQCISALTMGLFGLFFLSARLRPKVAPPTTFRTAQALRFSMPFVPHFLANWAFGAGDRWVLATFGQQADLGYYGLAQQLSSPVSMVSSALNDSQSPAQGTAYQQGGPRMLASAIKSDLLASLKLSGAIYLLLVLATPTLSYILGNRYHTSLYLLPLVAIGGVIEGAYYPPINALFFLGHTRTIPLVTSTSAIVSIALTAPLTAHWGMPGLLTARLLSSALRSSLCWMLAAQALKSSAKNAPHD